MRINSIFTSLEGEGICSGVPTLFIRTQGCDFKCPFCDTKDSWDEFSGLNYNKDQLMSKIQNSINGGIHRISFTGGNPLLHIEEIKEVVTEISKANPKIFSKNNVTFNLEHPGVNFQLDSFVADSTGIFGESANQLRNSTEFDTINVDIKLPIAKLYNNTEFADNIIEYITQIYEGKLSSNVYLKFLVDTSTEQLLIKILHLLGLYEINIPNPMFISPIIRGTEFLLDTTSICTIQREYSKYSKFVIENSNGLDVRLNVQMHKLINID